MEKWKAHPQLKYIEVSTHGNVRTLDRVHDTVCGERRLKGRLIKKFPQTTNKSKSKYEKCHIYTISSKKNHWVHRLVAETFLENPNGYNYVDHIDGNGLNNRVENLEWVSNSTNVLRAISKGKHKNVKYVNGLPISQISKMLGSMYGTLVSKRLKKGWCLDCAVNTPSLGMGGDHRKPYCIHKK